MRRCDTIQCWMMYHKGGRRRMPLTCGLPIVSVASFAQLLSRELWRRYSNSSTINLHAATDGVKEQGARPAGRSKHRPSPPTAVVGRGSTISYQSHPSGLLSPRASILTMTMHPVMEFARMYAPKLSERRGMPMDCAFDATIRSLHLLQVCIGRSHWCRPMWHRSRLAFNRIIKI